MSSGKAHPVPFHAKVQTVLLFQCWKFPCFGHTLHRGQPGPRVQGGLSFWTPGCVHIPPPSYWLVLLTRAGGGAGGPCTPPFPWPSGIYITFRDTKSRKNAILAVLVFGTPCFKFLSRNFLKLSFRHNYFFSYFPVSAYVNVQSTALSVYCFNIFLGMLLPCCDQLTFQYSYNVFYIIFFLSLYPV